MTGQEVLDELTSGLVKDDTPLTLISHDWLAEYIITGLMSTEDLIILDTQINNDESDLEYAVTVDRLRLYLLHSVSLECEVIAKLVDQPGVVAHINWLNPSYEVVEFVNGYPQ